MVKSSISVGAGFWIRALARTLDVLYGAVLGAVAGMFGGLLIFYMHQAGYFDPNYLVELKQFSFLAIFLALIGGFFYGAITEGFYGASVGKLICGLRVLNEDGEPCGLKGAIIRNLGYFIDALFFGLVGYESMKKTPLNQRFGDVWGKTVVVKTAEVPQGSNRSVLTFLAALAAASFFQSVMIVAGLLVKLL